MTNTCGDEYLFNKIIEVTTAHFNLYPNPAENFVHLTVPCGQEESEMTISIFDGTGREVIHGNGAIIDIRKLLPGIYRLRVYSCGRRWEKQFIKITQP